MKTTKRLWAVAMAAVVLGSAGFAAGETTTGSGAERGTKLEQARERRMEKLDGALKLSADQKAKIEAIWEKAEERTAEIREKNGLRKRKQRRELRGVMQETRAEVRAVLTPEQQKIFDAMPRQRDRSAEAE